MSCVFKRGDNVLLCPRSEFNNGTPHNPLKTIGVVKEVGGAGIFVDWGKARVARYRERDLLFLTEANNPNKKPGADFCKTHQTYKCQMPSCGVENPLTALKDSLKDIKLKPGSIDYYPPSIITKPPTFSLSDLEGKTVSIFVGVDKAFGPDKTFKTYLARDEDDNIYVLKTEEL